MTRPGRYGRGIDDDAGTSALLDPLVGALGRYVFAADKLHTDDTPVPVLCPGRGTTRWCRLWKYVHNDRARRQQRPPTGN